MSDQLAERVLSLERRLLGLQSEIDAVNARTGLGTSAPQIRIGRITGEPEDEDNVFDIIFEDGTYTPLAGNQTPDYQDRQQIAKTVVMNLPGTKIPPGTRVPVWYWSDRWWTWWTEGQESLPSNPKMCGFNDLTSMTSLVYDEDRVATFDESKLIGSISGLEWVNASRLWNVEVGDWLIEWGIQGHSDCSMGSRYPTDFKVNHLYAKLESRPIPDDEHPNPTWVDIQDSTLYCYAHFGGYWNSSSRSFLYRLTRDPQQVRMVCGIGQSSTGACPTGHIYDGHWHWTKVEFG